MVISFLTRGSERGTTLSTTLRDPLSANGLVICGILLCVGVDSL